jgi:hypothetical protein
MQSLRRNLKGESVVAVKKFPAANVVDVPPSPSPTTHDPPGTCIDHRIIVPCFFCPCTRFLAAEYLAPGNLRTRNSIVTLAMRNFLNADDL